MKIFTVNIRTAVRPKLTQCPNVRAADDTVPEIRPTSNAGQHQAPISAGILSTNVMSENMSEVLDFFGVVSRSDSGAATASISVEEASTIEVPLPQASRIALKTFSRLLCESKKPSSRDNFE